MSQAPAGSDPARAWRDDTPGCAEVVHLDNAGAALMPLPVLQAIESHLRLELVRGGYTAAEERAAAVAASYDAVARLINARPRNVAVVENATVAVSQALSSFDLQVGDTIVTSQADYPSNQLMYLALQRRRGVRLERAADLPEGGIDPDAVRSLLRRRRCSLVAVSWVPTNSGLVQRVEDVGAVCREAEVPFLVDACQAVGQLPIDVGKLGCDFLAAAGRKFLRGPRGIGFLYVSDVMLSSGAYPLLVDMRGAEWTGPDQFELRPDARRFENWEFAYALLLGQGAAVEYALRVGQAGFDRAQALASYLRERLGDLDGVTLHDGGRERGAIVTAVVGRWPAQALRLHLRSRGINVGASFREDGVIDMDAKRVSSLLRISPHYYNTTAELDELREALREACGSRTSEPIPEPER